MSYFDYLKRIKPQGSLSGAEHVFQHNRVFCWTNQLH